MKHNLSYITGAILLVCGLTLCHNANAGEHEHFQPSPGSIRLDQTIKIQTKAAAQAEAYAHSQSIATGGIAQGGNVNSDSDVAASSTATGSSNTTADCWRYDSTSGSFIFAGITKTLMIRDLVCTLAKPLNDEQKIALCLENSDYRKVRIQLGNACK